MYLVGSVLLALPLLIVALATGWPPAPTILLLLVTGCFIGGLRILREPRFWSVVAAIVATGVAGGFAIWSWLRLGWLDLYGAWALVIMVAFWVGVGQAGKAAALAEAHPEAYSARLMRGDLAHEGGRHAEAARAAARHRRNVRLGIAASVLTVIVGLLVWRPWGAPTRDDEWTGLIGVGGRSSTPMAPPGPIDTRIAEFSAAWARSDVAAINALRYDDVRARQSELFQRIVKKRGWVEKLPTVLAGEPDPTNRGGRATWYFAFADRPDDPPFKLIWEWDGTVWRLANMSFPRE
ncbi:MAG: hypothetical protein JNM10_09400 [Planctomycetia bacterium]|nr:hypothetical protein [Planctomycetia bacterium]